MFTTLQCQEATFLDYLLPYSAKKRQKKPKRADPKELRHEDSAAVWNELAYFKNENRNLVTERYAG